MAPRDAALAFARFGLGARPGDLRTTDAQAALLADIEDRDAALLDGPRLLDSAAAFEAYRAFREARKSERAEDAEADAMPAPMAKAGGKKGKITNYTIRTELPARLARIAEAPVGYAERLAMFWANHFAIESDNGGVMRALAGPFEREAIRPHVLGRFEDMVQAATRHPAMLTYLNNATSVGPGSKAGQRREAGLNENHARELMELHTLGVDGGYTQADVTSLARILTGWSVVRGKNQDGVGGFQFRKQAHEPGTHELLGESFAQPGIKQGEAALAMLAAHPATATHIAIKLARHFVADEPPEDLIARLAETFKASDGDLQAVSRALVEDEASWAPASKLRSPQEFLWASMRALAITPKPGEIVHALATLGQPLMNPPSPAGFSDETRTWLAPDAMTNRLDIAELLAPAAGDFDPRALAEAILGARLTQLTAQTIARAESPAQGLALMLMSPEFQRR